MTSKQFFDKHPDADEESCPIYLVRTVRNGPKIYCDQNKIVIAENSVLRVILEKISTDGAIENSLSVIDDQ